MATENRVQHSTPVQQEHFTVTGNFEIVFQSPVHGNGTIADATGRLHETVSVLVEYDIFAGCQ